MTGQLSSAAPIGKGGSSSAQSFDKVMAAIAIRAAGEDAGTDSIAGSVGFMRRVVDMCDDGSDSPAETARQLIRVGASNLSVGRLWEGHINAICLINVHGDATLRLRVAQMIKGGAFLGVWGADDVDPVIYDPTASELRGAKKFASGLGVVTDAVVSVNFGSDVRLALIDVTDPARRDASGWQMPGMRATASGVFDFNGVRDTSFDWIGAPNDYYREPHFIGGVWRIAALQIGGALGLLESAAEWLRERGRAEAEAQKIRLGSVAIQIVGGAALVDRAARTSVAAEPEKAVALSIAARLQTEAIALDVIRAVEQSVGLSHFDHGSETGRRARDLAVYLRQVARDALLIRFAEHALGGPASLGELIS